MFVKPRFVQFLTSVSVAAMFIATPIVGKFDAAGKLLIISAAAHAQDVTDLEPGPGPGDETPPTGPGDELPPTGPGDETPPTGPGGPFGPTDPVAPPTEPVEPPTEPVEPPTGPIDPPIEPVKPRTVSCDEKFASSKCVEPKPVVKAQTSDDRKDVPASLPVKAPVVPSAAEVALREANTLRCGGPCIIKVSADGKITVETSEFKIGTNKLFGVKLVLDGATVTSSQTEREGIISRPPTVETFATRQAALAFLASIVPTYN